jgi:hypothetical protein
MTTIVLSLLSLASTIPIVPLMPMLMHQYVKKYESVRRDERKGDGRRWKEA